MPDDLAVLEELNIRIGTAESAGDRDWLDGVMAPQLAIRRANKEVDDRRGYLAAVGPSAARETEVQSIQLHGNRAVVSCIVTMQTIDGERKKFHNLRLFIRGDAGWKLLGWANEPM